jgi:hypothetical protein
MAGTGGDYSTEWCWILRFVARHGAGTTRETATEFLIDEVAAGRIPFRYSNFWIEGPAIMPEHFWLRDPSVRHEVAVDNSVVRHGPGVTLAENAKGEHILVLATAPPARCGIARYTLVRLDHATVVRSLQAARPAQRLLTVIIKEVPTRAAKSEQALAPATEPQSAAAEPELDWSDAKQVMRTLGIRGSVKRAIIEAIAKLPSHGRYKGKRIAQILEGMGGEELRYAISFPDENADTCRRFMDAWKAKYPD